jgi:hypothetical protein
MSLGLFFLPDGLLDGSETATESVAVSFPSGARTAPDERDYLL